MGTVTWSCGTPRTCSCKFDFQGSNDSVDCFAGLGKACPSLETVEIICNPSHFWYSELEDPIDVFCRITVDGAKQAKFLKELFFVSDDRSKSSRYPHT